MVTENETRRAAPDLEKEALSIAAHTMQQAAEELRQELRQANKQITELQAERSRLLRELQAIIPPKERELLAKYREASEEAEQYLDYLRATHQLPSYGYWIKRRKEIEREEQQQKQSA
jgi:hypothetical protein